jgi:regulator of sigma E protease
MQWWEWIVSILLFIVSLTVIVAIHEAGHLSMAKLFNVYCQEYSIGFGPAIFKKKRKGGETYFSIRAIPLGGYVSMYGEEIELEEGVEVPKERSLEGIKKWQKIIVVSAGVILNAITAFILIFISNVAFPLVRTTSYATVTPESVAYNAGIREDDKLQIYYSKAQEVVDDDKVSIRPIQATFTNEKGSLEGAAFFVVDHDIKYNEHNYVLTYYPVTTKENNVLTNCLTLYVGADKEEVEKDADLKAVYADWMKEEDAPKYYPNFKKKFEFRNEEIPVKLRFKNVNGDVNTYPITLVSKDGKLTDFGVSLKLENVWLPFGTRMENTFIDFGNASVAVFKGIGALFTSGIRNMSGIVGIFNLSAQLYGNYQFATYLYFWGLISINLAIFNLLPFPGLDGWQILVTSIEGISKKKIPNKVKNIVSMIGLALLFTLMAAIIVMDILRITGVF